MNPSSKLRALSSLPFVAFRRSRVFATLAAIITFPAHAILDTNNNGLSDLWEKQHNNGNLFPNTFLATNDEDQDGWTNAKEATAGTDPFNSNPPDGIVTVTITPSLTAGAFTLTWPTLVGKNYQLKVSTDLTTWTNLGNPITSYENSHSIGINTIQPDTTFPPKVFWQVVVGDLDTDGDGLTDAEEHKLNTDPGSPNSIAGIPDLWLATYFSSILLTSGISGIDLYADTDGDGYTNLEEHLKGTDPNVSDAPTEQQWIIVKGDGPQGETRTRIKQITIPKGQTRLVVIAIASEEYPEFTEPDDIEQYDDLLTWNIAPSGQTPIAGEVHVNDRHVDWQLAEIDGQTLAGIPGPVHYEVVRTITANEESDLTIDVEITATNIADELLPSYVAVGLVELEVKEVWSDQIAGVEANGFPDKTGPNEYPYIFMGASSGSNFGVKIKLASAIPSAIRNKIIFRWASEGAFGEFVPESGLSFFSNDKTVHLNSAFNVGLGRERFLVMAIDENSNQEIDVTESINLIKMSHIRRNILSKIPCKFIPISQDDYEQSKEILTDWTNSQLFQNILTDSVRHLTAFCNGAVPAFAGNEPATIKRNEPGLSHPVGVAFTPLVNPGASFSATISKDHELSKNLIKSNVLRSWLSRQFNSVADEIKDDITEARKSGNPAQVLSYEIAAKEKNLAFGIDDPDLFLCLGKVTFENVMIDFDVDMFGIVSQVKISGTAVDLYDFDYEGEELLGYPARKAAEVQAGFPSLGAGGKVFKTKIDLGGGNPYADPNVVPYSFFPN